MSGERMSRRSSANALPTASASCPNERNRPPTTFVFVTDGAAAALERARAAAGDRDVAIAGGADVAQQFLRSGAVDELRLHVAPVFLGGGTRLFDGLPPTGLELARVSESSGVTHLDYRLDGA